MARQCCTSGRNIILLAVYPYTRLAAACVMVLSSTVLPLVPSLMRGAVPLLPCVLPWHGQWQLSVSVCLFPYWICCWWKMLVWESVNCMCGYACTLIVMFVDMYMCVYKYVCIDSMFVDMLQKTISTWKKWSAGDSGPGGRISGSVCGLDPK